jgi:hypothetical protein
MNMPAAREPLFECQECGKKYYTAKAAERAMFSDRGCPGCGGSDIDTYVGKKSKNIGKFGSKGGIWRPLDPEETKEFRKWARDNYVISTPINKVWHPAIQEECHKMNREYSSAGKSIGKFGGQILRIPIKTKNPGKGAGIRDAKLNDKKAEWAKKERK